MGSLPQAGIPDAAPTGTSMQLTAAEHGTTGGYSVSVPSPCVGFCRLYDFGLGATAAAFCIRASDPDLTRELDNCIRQEWADLLAKHGGRIVQVSPSRVVLSPIGRVEVLRGLHFGDSASGLAAAVGERLS
jgi:hypothetical protein